MLLLALLGLWYASIHSEPGPSVPPPRTRPELVRPTERHSPPASPWTPCEPVKPGTLYCEAFALLEALSSDDKQTLADWKSDVDPAVAVALCGKLKPIVALAHEAAAVTNSDWSVRESTFYTREPHMNPVCKLARATIWHAAHCREDDSEGAGKDIEVVLRTGQNAPRFLDGYRVNTAIQSLALDYLSVHAGALPGDVVARLAQSFGDDSYEESFFRTVEDSADTAMRAASNVASMTPEQFAQRIHSSPPIPQSELVAGWRQMAELYSEYVRVLGATDTERQAWLAKVRAAEQEHPRLHLDWQGLAQAEERTRTMIVQRALMAAGLALQQDGTSALECRRDPATGQAFVHRQTATGFELQSAYQTNGKPLVMTFPNR